MNMRKHLTALLAIMALAAQVARADEGMWLPMHIKRLNHADMQKQGLKLTADELYSVNKGSLKDAIVSLGGFCTGEIISKNGLMLTNHHCGYESIQSHSSVEHDYLTNGFWAMTREQELPNAGLYASFLVRMEDVSARMLATVNGISNEGERNQKLAAEGKKIQEEATKGTHYNASVKPFFNGNEFYLFVYETFRDVRLVGAPPSSIGKFGGDTDNWMWPRHTGDFSLFRVYAGKDGKPAEYSKDNVPLTPRHHLPVSMSGVREGDFSMIFGYPGTTDRYLTSYGVQLALDVTNPLRVKIRGKKLEIMKKDMDAADAVRIKYASNYAKVSNYWKYFIGQSAGLKRLNVLGKKQAEETAFTAWVNKDASRKELYGNALADVQKGFDAQRQYKASQVALQEAVFGVEIFTFALQAKGLEPFLGDKEKMKSPQFAEAQKELLKALDELYKDYYAPLDQKMTAAMVKMYRETVPADQLPDLYKTIDSKYKGDYEKYAADVFAKSMFTSREKAEAFFKNPDSKKLNADPAYVAINSYYNNYLNGIAPKIRATTTDVEKGNRLYVAGLLQMKPDHKFYPNANSTMRMTYGNVKDYVPRDGVKYNLYTTIDGIMEKEDNTNDEFVVPKKLRQLWEAKDYGPYAENGVLKVGFISNNDITGGNSGSPVINGRGELIGCAFDGNWEAMSGDIAFEPELQRTISVDIRYILFIIDKFAGAKHLVDEMTLTYAPVEKAEVVPAVAPAPAPALVAPTLPAAKAAVAKPARTNTAKAVGKPAAAKAN